MYPNNDEKIFTTTNIVMLFVCAALLLTFLQMHNYKTNVPDNATQVSQIKSVSAHPSKLPQFDGFGTLTEKGITDSQMTALKYAYWQYTKAQSNPAKIVNLDADTIKKLPKAPGSINNTMTFDVTLSDTRYSSRIDYYGISNIQLRIFDTSNNPVYDSGSLNINTQAPKP